MPLLVPNNAVALRSNNFDAIRLAMALLVVWSHSFALYLGSEKTETLSRITNGYYNSGNFAVLVFFIISGFLVCRSYLNSASMLRYFSKRVRRIYPGYLVATSICAFVVIPIFSSHSINRLSFAEVEKTLALNLILRNYFPASDAFSNNRYAAINGSLWSIPFEFWCYIGLAALGAVRLLSIRGISILITLAAMFIRTWLDASGKKPGGGLLGEIIGWPYLWFSILPCFMFGVIAYQYRTLIPRSRILLVLVLGAFLAVCHLPIQASHQKLVVDFLFPFVVSYSVFYFAFQPSLFHNISKWGDFSYGTYLYAFTLQQMLLASSRSLPFYGFVVLSLSLSLFAGVASWHLVEKWFLPKSRLHRLNRDSETRNSSREGENDDLER